MKKIYCISGLGSDEKIFTRIQVPGYELAHIAWLPPERNEPIETYARRMAASIQEDNPILMGLSFGGMLGIEIAKLLPVKKLILLSSISSVKEMPFWMRGCGKLRLHKLVPLRSYRILQPLENYNMGVTNAEEKRMVQAYRNTVDQAYLNWAVDKILSWKNNWQPEHLYHIHGDTDRIFPIKKIKTSFIVKGGGHFMVYNKAAEVNLLLRDIVYQ